MKEEKSLDLSSCGYDIIVLALVLPTLSRASLLIVNISHDKNIIDKRAGICYY